MFQCLEVGASRLKFPIEVCIIARAQRYDRELNVTQRTNMIDVTRMVCRPQSYGI